jgi:hypothetical protein
MKVNCGETWQEKKERLEDWHRFFCLWPRRVGHQDCRWLEYVERKGEYWSFWGDAGWIWEYRAIK